MARGRGLTSFEGWVRYLSQYLREFVPKGYSYGAISKFELRGDRRAEQCKRGRGTP